MHRPGAAREGQGAVTGRANGGAMRRGWSRAVSSFRAFAGAAALASSAMCAMPSPARASAAEEGYAPPGVDLAAPRAHPDWPCLASLLQQIVDDDERARGLNVLHIGRVVSKPASDSDFVRVYWPRRRAILIVQLNRAGCADPHERYDPAALGWYRTKARIDLEHDVVPTAEDIHGSNYLVSRPWVEAVIEECTRHGTALKLRRSPRSRADGDAPTP